MTLLRRDFIHTSAGSAIAIFGLPMIFSRSSLSPKTSSDQLPYGFPSQDRDSVRDVVGAAHGRFDRLKELVEARPELAKATWDWGFGDWESAIGAASHMGRVDIAEFLIAHGARPNLFTYTIMGKVDAVKAIVNEMPGIQRIHGPHGITLMRHARIRSGMDDLSALDKQNMEEIIDFLESVGDADIAAMSLDITEEEQKVYMGKYTFGSGEDEYFTVELNRRGMLYMSRAENIGRVLLRTGEHTFSPGGAPSVKISFDVSGNSASQLTIFDPTALVTATRV